MKGIRDAEPSRRKLARATLSDVAKEAGVSVMTVSNFVRAKPVRLQTRKRVEEAIARLNYRPNVSARSLRLSEEYSVGIVIADSDPACTASYLLRSRSAIFPAVVCGSGRSTGGVSAAVMGERLTWPTVGVTTRRLLSCS